jgi:hypothetical protein
MLMMGIVRQLDIVCLNKCCVVSRHGGYRALFMILAQQIKHRAAVHNLL